MAALNQAFNPRDVSIPHWHALFCDHFTQEAERYEVMGEIMQEHGVADFNPRLIAFFQSLISQRYFENSPVFLNSSEIQDSWTPSQEQEDGIGFDKEGVHLFFPMLETRPKLSSSLPSFGFISRSASSEYSGPLNPSILKNVKRITGPAVVMKPELEHALAKHDSSGHFINYSKTLIEGSNHDFIHGLTNADRDQNIPEGFDFKTKIYLRQFVNPDLAANGFRIEECAVLEMNRLIFERLRARSNSAWAQNFFEAIKDVSEVIAVLDREGEVTAAKNARSIVKNFLSFFVNKKQLDQTPVTQWAQLLRERDTRQDIRIFEYTYERPFTATGVALNGLERPVEKELPRKPALAEIDAHYKHLVAQGKIRQVNVAKVFQRLHESVQADLNSDLLIGPKDKRSILQAAHFSPQFNQQEKHPYRVYDRDLE